MIKSLNLENYGRFKKAVFNFSPVSIFYGPNEAGKTTIFDALLDAISSPKASTTMGKHLLERYGAERSSKPDYEGDKIIIPTDDFLNIFAVRSGIIELNIDKNSQWMNKVKASLFSGGIDTKDLLNELETILASKARNTLKGEEQNLESSLEKINSEKKNYLSIREKCIAEERLIKGKELKMQNAALEINDLEAEEKELDSFLYQQKQIKEEKHLKSILSVLGEASRKKDENEKYNKYKQDTLSEIQKTERELVNAKSELTKIIALEEAALKDLGNTAREKSLAEENNNNLEKNKILSDLLKESLVPRDKLISEKNELIIKKHFLAAGALALITGITLFFLTSFNFVFPAAALGIGILCFVLSREKRILQDYSRLEEAILSASKKWKAETGEECPDRYDAILEVLNSAGEKARAAAAELERIRRRREEFEEKAQVFLIQKNSAGNNADAIQRRLRELLDEAGSRDLSEYSAQLERKKQLIAQYADLNLKIENYASEYGAKGANDLFDTVNRKLKDISLNISEKEESEVEIRNYENKLRTVKSKLEQLRVLNIEFTGGFNKELGLIRGQLRGLPEKIYECEKNAQKIELRLEEIKKELRAAKIAHELYTSLADDSEKMLKELSGDIGEIFKEITREDRRVEMANYSANEMEVIDAGGEMRYMNMLSAGTKDAFLLAARLTLAYRSMDPAQKAVLVLDEPFIALDSERCKSALAMLKTFREKSGYQIILLTKDCEVKEEAKLLFGSELTIHEL